MLICLAAAAGMATLVVLDRARTILLDGGSAKRRSKESTRGSSSRHAKRAKAAEPPVDYEPPFRSAWHLESGFRHFSHYYCLVYQGLPRKLSPEAVERTRDDFFRCFLDEGSPRGLFMEIRERMECDRFRERPLLHFYSRFGAESETRFMCAWLADELPRLRDFVARRFRFAESGERVWLRFESELVFAEAVRIVVALAVGTRLMRDPEDFGELRYSPMLVWLLLGVAASSDRTFEADWMRFYRLMKQELDHDEMAYALTFLVTVNAYLPYMSDRLRARLSDNGFLEVEYRTD